MLFRGWVFCAWFMVCIHLWCIPLLIVFFCVPVDSLCDDPILFFRRIYKLFSAGGGWGGVSSSWFHSDSLFCQLVNGDALCWWLAKLSVITLFPSFLIFSCVTSVCAPVAIIVYVLVIVVAFRGFSFIFRSWCCCEGPLMQTLRWDVLCYGVCPACAYLLWRSSFVFKVIGNLFLLLDVNFFLALVSARWCNGDQVLQWYDVAPL